MLAVNVTQPWEVTESGLGEKQFLWLSLRRLCSRVRKCVGVEKNTGSSSSHSENKQHMRLLYPDVGVVALQLSSNTIHLEVTSYRLSEDSGPRDRLFLRHQL